MLKIEVNKDKIIYYNQVNGEVMLNEKEFNIDMTPFAQNSFHILRNNKGYTIEIVEFIKSEKTFKLKINNKEVTVNIKDSVDLLVEKMGFTVNESLKINTIKAPMPGLIVNLLINPGQEVEIGENLIVLEAMKMENIIKSPTKGIIKSIKIKKGESVEKNQILVEFE